MGEELFQIFPERGLRGEALDPCSPCTPSSRESKRKLRSGDGGVWPLRAREVRLTERGRASSGRPAESKESLCPPCSRSLKSSSFRMLHLHLSHSLGREQIYGKNRAHRDQGAGSQSLVPSYPPVTVAHLTKVLMHSV